MRCDDGHGRSRRAVPALVMEDVREVQRGRAWRVPSVLVQMTGATERTQICVSDWVVCAGSAGRMRMVTAIV